MSDPASVFIDEPLERVCPKCAEVKAAVEQLRDAIIRSDDHKIASMDLPPVCCRYCDGTGTVTTDKGLALLAFIRRHFPTLAKEEMPF